MADIFHVFAFAHRLGVPKNPIFKILSLDELDGFVANLLRKNKAKRLFVYDWQQNGIRMRVASFQKVGQVDWSEPKFYWLVRG